MIINVIDYVKMMMSVSVMEDKRNKIMFPKKIMQFLGNILHK